jgi:hypothetical protein
MKWYDTLFYIGIGAMLCVSAATWLWKYQGPVVETPAPEAAAPVDPESLPPTGPGSAVAQDVPVVVGWRIETVPVFTITPRVTCYSKYSGKVEAQGLYSAYWRETHKVLPMQERIIQDSHYTVALPPEYDRYVQELIRLPNGVWTFRWLVHVNAYNWDADKAVGKDAWRFYSVPRDRCPSAGVFDVLFTGYKGAVDHKVKHWKEDQPLNQPCTFYEVVPILVYSDGSEAVYGE